ncbi:TfoX/Sxy family protein [Actinomadura rupiterrae]|uniref:TfoX/Sxy family protein n=1 Tax=Actinomadura rupiterrae TaxID=559627 RepID=UPI0020A5C1F1|nr:TfoX/Sxy family protein [Actinomadura rupiterrae]MCP2343663.1 TfoX/Sxy family transcriptional regulator of competence genes [Actinomadura rupiterrae]
MGRDGELAERVRAALAGRDDVREVRMFGGLSFMVAEKLAVSANPAGRLLVRCDPGRVDDLLAEDGARWAEMRGKPMGKGWITVDASGVASDRALASWIEEALAYNAKARAAGES